jgi:hypothetical protein
MSTNKIIDNLTISTEIYTLKIAIINILIDFPKEVRMAVLKEMSDMYKLELLAISKKNK